MSADEIGAAIAAGELLEADRRPAHCGGGKMATPKKLYKYRRFDVTTLNMVTDHGLYFANPRKFNDPLDCELSIEANISPRKLSGLLKPLMPARKAT